MPRRKTRTTVGRRKPSRSADGAVVCFFRAGPVSSERYVTLGFTHHANLDDGAMWPIAFALTELTAAEEARIAALIQQAAR
jgi:hypothetical protein